jgi:O-antigen ligase/tetratricopeptide (TPR) repeat protein
MKIDSKFKLVFLVGFFLILALPLLNLPPWFSPPDWGKTIIFRSVLSILLFIFLYQILNARDRVSGEFSRKVKIGIYLLLVLLGIFFLATVFSLDRNFSLWGSPYRSGGFVNFAFYIIFAILTFLILEESDWQKIWDFSIFIGILVSLVAICQWQGWLKNILITYPGRPPSTIGGPIFLAIYLLLLSFFTLGVGLNEQKKRKRFFYLGSFFLFVFVIFLTYTRAAFFGFFIGILYFIFFYPRKIILTKILAFLLLALVIYGVYYVNTTAQFPKFVQENKLLSGFINRLFLKRALEDPRIAGWKVSFKALKERPILGYGPENFSIAFDKYYDPTLPNITKIAGSGGFGWWDRAHNFLFDISITAGIPALIVYLSLFGILFWQLQGLKKKNYQKSLMSHGIKSAFLAYLVANFFSFDVFSTYLISFLMIGYSLSLINFSTRPGFVDVKGPLTKNKKFQRLGLWKLKKYKEVILFVLFILLVWFIWNFNIKPFQINTQINVASYQQEQGDCQGAIQRMERIINTRTFLDSYLRLKYANIIKNCLSGENPEFSYQIAKRGVEILKENTEIQPYYTRNWLFLGILNTYLLEKEKTSQTPTERIIELKKEVDFAFENALKLSPKRPEIFLEWLRADIVMGEFERAREKANQCIQLDPSLAHCYWVAGIVDIYLGNKEQAQKNLRIAKEKKYRVNSEISLLQLVHAYAFVKDYQELVRVYRKLITIQPKNPQYHASLATVYKKVGDYENARKEALKVYELSPQSKEEVEKFLQSLPK